METQTIKFCTYENTLFNNDQIADFLHEHLDQFGDEKEDILKCLSFVQDKDKGGEIILASNENEIIGAVVFSFIGYFYVKNRGKGKFAKKFIPTIRDMESEKECIIRHIIATGIPHTIVKIRIWPNPIRTSSGI